jgi:transposase-like protein
MSRLHGLEVLVVHAKPRLSPWSRLLLVERVAAGRPAAQVAAEMGVSRATAYKWLARYRAEGSAGLLDRSSRPRSCPTRTDPLLEAAIVALRRDRRLGPARIAGILGLNPSTVHRVLVRRPGYDFVHCAIDDHTRLAYAEIHRDETSRHLRGVPAPGSRLVRRARHRAHRAGHDRQRAGLPTQPGLA